METIIYKKIDQDLIKEWEILWKKSSFANYFNTPQWFLSALESFRYQEYIVLTLYKGKQLSIILPLVKQKKYGFDFYTIPGDFTCGIPFLFETYDKKMMKVFFDCVAKIGNVFLDEIPDLYANDMKSFSANTVTFPCSFNFFLKRDTIQESFVVNRAKALKKIKHIEEKFILQKSHNLLVDLKTAFSIDRKSSKHAKGYNIFSEKKTKLFYQSLSKNMPENFSLHLLFFENKPIAYELGFSVNNIYYGNQMAFDVSEKRYSPGKIVVTQLIEKLNNENTLQIDFGSGDSEFKRFFSSECVSLNKVIISNNFFIRNYIKVLYQSKNYFYKKLTESGKLYGLYRNVRRKLS